MFKRVAIVFLLAISLIMATSFQATAFSNETVRVIIELEADSLIEREAKSDLSPLKMDDRQKDQLRNKLVRDQVSVKQQIRAEKIDIDYHYDFVNVINGFSGTISVSDIEKIAKIPGVKIVRIAQTYKIPPLQPNMSTSKQTVNALATWDLGYTGVGKAVAIIDTTVDPTHKDMRLSDTSDSSKMKLTEGAINFIKNNTSLPGVWFSYKVPYGHNYGDGNNHLATPEFHGMHVAGIVAANTSNETEGLDGIKGVAPESQLFAMKVISDKNSEIVDDAIYKAMEDSVTLGADVVNLSLGRDAGFINSDPLFYKAVQKLVTSGIVPVIAAGNSGYMGWGYKNPFAVNPDIGVAGMPGIIPGSLCVASIDNVTMYKTIKFKEYTIPYWASSEGKDPLSTFSGDEIEYVDCGEGIIIEGQNDFSGLVVNGKIALIKRGTIGFEDKIINAQGQGAAGVIIYNHEEGGNKFIDMEYDTDTVTIPAVFIGNDHGEILKGNQEAGKTLKFTDIEVPLGGDMSYFTSWGTSPSLDFKPDITAPGGNIYSTLPDNKYGTYSGTSMACPYAAGGIALVLQRMENDDYLNNLKGAARVNMAKNLLMSTAHPQEYKPGIQISPRRQGAGLMDLYAATTTKAYLKDKSTGLSKVNLKEIKNSTTFAITLTNFGAEDLEYTVTGSVLTSFPYYSEEDGITYIDQEKQAKVVDATSKIMPISFSGISGGAISVSPGATKEFTVHLDLSNPECELKNISTGVASQQALNTVFLNGTFVEGFISLNSTALDTPSLSIPYMGFYGEWDKAPIFDHSIYTKNSQAFYNINFEKDFRGTYLRSGQTILGVKGELVNQELIAISPNGDGEQDDVQAVVELLRNALEIDIDILNESGEIVHDFEASEYHVKNYFADYEPPLELDTWNGKIGDNVIDGKYTYQAKARIDFEESKWQTLRFPVRVDTIPPVINSLKYDETDDTITVVANDGIFTGISYMLYQDPKGVIAESENGIFHLSSLSPRPSQVQVIVKDAAGNKAVKKLKIKSLGSGGGAAGGGGALPLDPPPNSQIVNPQVDQALSIEGAKIELPKGAVGEKVEISVQELSSVTNLPGQNRLVSQVYEFTKDKPGNFLKPVLITLSFRPDKIDRNIYEPVLCWLNEITQLWERIEGSKFDWETGTVSGSVNHFTKFAVLNFPIETNIIDINGHWAQENIKKMVNQKIINGYEDKSFRPDNEISRAEFCTMLVKYLKLGQSFDPEVKSFTDIKAHWAEAYIEAAYRAGIVDGYSSKHFGPDDHISREQMAVMIGKAMKIQASSGVMLFNDTPSISPWATSFVAAAVHEKILTGYPDASFRPQNKTTRAEAVTVITKLNYLH